MSISKTHLQNTEHFINSFFKIIEGKDTKSEEQTKGPSKRLVWLFLARFSYRSEQKRLLKQQKKEAEKAKKDAEKAQKAQQVP